MKRKKEQPAETNDSSENSISRRGFLGGLALLGTAGILAPVASAVQVETGSQTVQKSAGDDYPPAKTGLRGSCPGAYESGHALAWNNEGNKGELTASPEEYDLIVVGAGVSGLTAALIYREKVKKDAKILILDNHDDFGGHATRNEFKVDGKTYITYGGNQSVVSPGRFGESSADLFQKLGLKMADFEKEHYQFDFFPKHNLSVGVFYDKATFGANKLIKGGLPSYKEPHVYSLHFMAGLEKVKISSFEQLIAATPLNAEQQKQVKAVWQGSPKAEAYFSGEKGKTRFDEKTYPQFLEEVYGITDPALILLFSMLMSYDSALGGNMISIAAALESRMLGLPKVEFFIKHFDYEPIHEEEPFVHHPPDGCGSIPRLLVKKLIPDIADFKTPAECVTALFDYSKLDRPNQPVRIKLGSTAVYADNKNGGTVVRYLKNGSSLFRGELYEARAKHTIMAGWHILAAHMIPSLSSDQKKALQADIKLPLVWAQVFLNNWQAVKKSGVGIAYAPGAYYQSIQCDFPVSMGAYQPTRTPDQPLSLLMVRMPCPPFSEKSTPDVVKAGLAEMLSTDLQTFEDKIREQLTAMYGDYGFDAKRDIAGITVNLWPHGYLWTDAKYKGEAAYLTARKKHGNITFANSDSAGNAYLDNAIDMAYEAVKQLAK